MAPLSVIPLNEKTSKVDSTSFATPSVAIPSLPDTLREQKGPLSIASEINGKHPLEARLKNWEENEHNNKLETYRRIFGAGEPIKRQMELGIVDATDFKPAILGGPSNLHRNILLNKDTSVDWEDVYTGFDSVACTDMHTEMERKVGI
ncbi:BA75_02750T0 [Komagataella pastoris]|uniref:BA75_02750T0 n=1 Tax=Komagataella pastoris TaxID=4922 RepID=A0A1B2JC00_PICPA|nr:BA75_02750T0 [Komagataella pastoris]